jgi:hypothetical protein
MGNMKGLAAPQQLPLLHPVNIFTENTRTGKYYNPALASLVKRFEDRHKRNPDMSMDYREAVNFLLKERRAIRHLKKECGYDRDVNTWTLYNQDENILKIIPFVFGRSPIINRKTGLEATVRSGHKEDLALVTKFNLKGKNKKGGYLNPELCHYMKSAERAHDVNINFLDYAEIINFILHSNRAREYFGGQASYSSGYGALGAIL